MNRFSHIEHTFGHIALCILALMILPSDANAEPSESYLKCQKLLTSRAAGHLKKTRGLRQKYDTKVDKLLQRAVDNNSARTSSNEDLRDSVERIRKWRHLDQARAAYVDEAIENLSLSADKDGPKFKCHDRGSIDRTYKLSFEGYKTVLQLIEKDVKQRFELEDLQADEGLVVIAFNSSESVNFVRINRRNAIGGNIMFGPIRQGEYFRVVRAKAGTYNWDEIEQKFYQSRREFDFRNLDLRFVVEAGKLNYAGVFLFDVRTGGYYTATLNDRLIITLTVLEQRYPELVERYEIANGLHPDDRFTEFYLHEQRLAKSEASNDDHE